MYQRLRILDLWEKAGLKQSRNRQVREFIRFVEDNPGLGWEGYVKKCRQDYPGAISELVPPLLASGDNLIIMNLFRLADFKRRRESEIAKRFAREADADKHVVALEFLAKTGSRSIKAELAGRAVLPGRIKQLLAEEEMVARGRLPTPGIVPETSRSIG